MIPTAIPISFPLSLSLHLSLSPLSLYIYITSHLSSSSSFSLLEHKKKYRKFKKIWKSYCCVTLAFYLCCHKKKVQTTKICVLFLTQVTSTTPMATASELFLDEKWKLSRKEGSRSVTSSALIRKISSSSKSKHHENRRCGFTRKCASLVKEQRARFYIMRRCVTMLICWRDNFSDSWSRYVCKLIYLLMEKNRKFCKSCKYIKFCFWCLLVGFIAIFFG